MTKYLFILITILAFASVSASAAMPTNDAYHAMVEDAEDGCNDSFASV